MTKAHRDPGMLEGLSGRDAFGRVDGQHLIDQILGFWGDGVPLWGWELEGAEGPGLPSLPQATPAISQPLTGRGAGRGPTGRPLRHPQPGGVGGASPNPRTSQNNDQRERRPPSSSLKLCPIWRQTGHWLKPRLQNQKTGFKSWVCLLGSMTLGESRDSSSCPSKCCED